METLPAMAPDRLSENFSPNASCTVDVHMAGSSKVLGYPVIPVLSKVDSKAHAKPTSASSLFDTTAPHTTSDHVCQSNAVTEIKASQNGITSSQRSNASISSSGPPRLAPSSSDVSANTDPDTRQTSPVSSVTRDPIRGSTRPATPRSEGRAESRAASYDESPMSSTTANPVAYGTKRTASGTSKAVTAVTQNNETDIRKRKGHGRHSSHDPRVGRTGNLTSQLRTRLSYAMVKVQNGWEKSSIDEIEESLSRNASPTVMSPGYAAALRANYSPEIEPESAPDGKSGPEDRSRMDVDTNATTQDFEFRSSAMQDTLPLSSEPLSSHLTLSRVLDVPSHGDDVSVQPSPGLASRRSKHRYTSSATMENDTLHYVNTSESVPYVQPTTMPTPSTPLQATAFSYLSPSSQQQQQVLTPNRPSVLRMPSKQAEKDAIDTLVLMRSPYSATFAKGGQRHDRMGGAAMGM